MSKNTLFLLFFIFSFFTLHSQCWNLVWEDNFSGASLDASKWTPQIGGGGWGNNELQYYTGRVNNATVSGGNLQIIAQEENYMGANYTSARLRSIHQGDWKYGRFEARIKTPIGQGIWPAFWMLSTDSPYGAWPQNGEIDIMELVGHQPQTSYASFHYGTAGNLQTQSTGYTLSSGNFNDNFHVFVLEWEATALRFYIDGVLYFTGTQASVAPYNWPFDQKFHFLLNVAIGGNWPGSPDASTFFPQTMEVDYVRVYQQLADVNIEGKDLVLPNTAATVYTLANIAGTTYSWTVPVGATIVSGQNTNEITVNWGTTSGQVTCLMTNACGAHTAGLDVTVSPNMLANYGFENDFTNWVSRTDNGANANFNILTNNVQEGLQSASVEVLNTGVNNWDVQLIHGDLSYVSATDYTLSFWAKADVTGRQITAAFINPTTYVLYNVKGFTLTDTWAKYTYTFTASVTSDVQMNMDLGQAAGTYFLDDFLFTKTALLPVGLWDFSAEVVNNRAVRLLWGTFSEQNNLRFDIEKSINGNWVKIGEVAGHGNSNTSVRYEFMDRNPALDENLYRLKQVDFDGKEQYSAIVSAFLKSNAISIYPNPTHGNIELRSTEEMTALVFVSTLTGEKIRRATLKGNQLNLNLSDLPRGLYLISVLTKGGIISKKIILQN